jgi:predicted dehydrogenase
MKILFAGLGSIGQRHLRNIRLLLGQSVELLAYRVRRASPLLTENFDVDSSSSVEAAYAIRSFDDLDRALVERPSVAFVCNPTGRHLSVALAAARAGCQLFIEKPLADRIDDVDELIACVESNGSVALVGYQMRFHPALQRLRVLLDRGAVGRLVSARAEIGEFLPSAHPHEDYRESYAGRADLGGGVVLSQSHELDYIRWLFGMPRRVFSTGGRLSDLEIDVEDTAHSVLECIVDHRPVAIHLSQDFVRRPTVRVCDVIGDSGTIHVDLRAPRLEVFNAGGCLVECQSFKGFSRNDLFVSELRHFFACLDGTETPAVSLRDAAESLRLALAIKKSIATGEAVHL